MGKFYSTDSSSSILNNPLDLEGYKPGGNSLDEDEGSLWSNFEGPKDFLGQAAYGFSEAASLGAVTIAEIAKE